MTSRQITAPTVLAVSLEDARANLRVDGTDLDSLITLWVQGITASMEHEIGQCIMAQTWKVSLDAFPTEIALPHPVIGITSVKYFDVAGVEQTLATSAYKINRSAYKTTITPVFGTTWPVTQDDTGVITVIVECGYGSTPASTPANVRLYILAKLVEGFDPATRSERDTVQSNFITRLLDACRSYA